MSSTHPASREHVPDIRNDDRALGDEVSPVLVVLKRAVWDAHGDHGTPAQEFFHERIEVR